MIRFLVTGTFALTAILGSTTLFASQAHAAALRCDGNYLFNSVNFSGKTSGSKLTNGAKVTVYQGGQVFRSETLQVTSSQIAPGKFLSFSGQSRDGQARGTASATFVQSEGRYHGTAQVQSSQGNFSAPVVCTLQ